MRLFLIEGKFNNPIPVGGIGLDVLMHEHNEMMTKEINKGNILFTGLKKDLSGVLFLMKAESLEEIEEFTKLDPLYKKDVQSYKILEFKCKDVIDNFKEWFNN